MNLGLTTRRAVGMALGLSLLVVLACGSSDEPAAPAAPAAPTATPTAPAVFPTFTLPTATPVPAAPLPGVTVVAKPKPTATPKPALIPGEKPLYGGVTNLPMTGTNRWDPLHGNQGFGWGTIANIGNLFGQYIRANLTDRLTLEGDLAESWEIKDGGKTWVLKIRKGVLDHEGNEFTVEDAYYNAYRIIERPNGVRANRFGCFREFLSPITEGDNGAGATIANPGAEITGPNELTLRLPVAKGAWVNCFASGWNSVTPSKYAKQIDADTATGYRDFDFDKGEVVGTGPFKIVEGEMANYWKAERHSQYFRDGRPYMDGFNLFAIPDATTRIANFRVGRIDAAEVFSTGFKLRPVLDLQKAIGEEAAFPIVAAPGFRGFELNVTKAPFGPQTDPTARKVRQAIQTRMDRGEMSKLCHDGIGFFSTPYFIGQSWVYTQEEWFENLIGLDPNTDKKKADVVAAQALMKSAGYGPDNRISTDILENDACRADLIVEQLSDIYIDVTRNTIASSGVIRETAKKLEFGLRLESKGASFVDPAAFYISIHQTFEKGGFTFGGWDNPKWYELKEKELLLVDEKDRAPVLREMADILWNQDAGWIGMVRPGLLQGHRGTWRGWSPPLFHASNYSLENVWLSPVAKNPYPALPQI